jgi:hypothetical protein
MKNEEEEERQRLYAETRKDLLTRQLSNSEKFDGAILTLSTGGLGISLAFIKDIVPIEKTQCVVLLIVSWRFFGSAIVSTLISFLMSQKGIDKQLHYAEEYYLNQKNEYLTKTNIPAEATKFLNLTSAILFIIAIVLTITFVSINIGR